MKAGFVGWRGMVGSVLMQRMREEDDFQGLECTFFSTSNAGGAGPKIGGSSHILEDAHDLKALSRQDVILSCQGGDYTKAIYGALRAEGWRGYWIDAASALRMAPDATIVLDPINATAIRSSLATGGLTFVGANCTVSLMLMGLAGLVRTGQIEWISTMTYQAASGAGAKNMRELVAQMAQIGANASSVGPADSILTLDQNVADTLSSDGFPTANFGAPLAASAIPWIDRLVEGGQTREEWKGMAEANRLLERTDSPLPIDGICVRIGAMRCHAQALTVKLRQDIPLDELNALLHEAHPWSHLVPNDKASTLRDLTPAAVAGSLQVPIGRVRKMTLGPKFVTGFTVGDQLLWGAAEPLRRTLVMIREYLG